MYMFYRTQSNMAKPGEEKKAPDTVEIQSKEVTPDLMCSDRELR